MISRTFAKRLKKFHFVDKKYKIAYKSPNKSILFTDYGSLDSFFFDIGVTYTLPIFGLNSASNLNVREGIGSDAIKYWWKINHTDSQILSSLHYNKGDDEWKMEVMFDTQGGRPEVYMDDVEGIMIWI